MVCSNCKSEVDSVKAVIAHGEIIEGCENCLAGRIIVPNELAAKNRRAHDQATYRKDIVQPFEKEYAKAQPEDFRSRYGDAAFRKYG